MVRNVELQRSSGYELLDERALAVVRRVSKLFVPFRLRGREHAVTVPVGFYLKEI
jgi:TonB family protein